MGVDESEQMLVHSSGWNGAKKALCEVLLTSCQAEGDVEYSRDEVLMARLTTSRGGTFRVMVIYQLVQEYFNTKHLVPVCLLTI